jgi:5S rRNA maturation endonuclease (ribonuclease M5)
MRDGTERMIGIQRRTTPRKRCVDGSHLGLFIPTGLNGHDLLLIAEGASDCAALLDMGFSAIGRPNCNSGDEMCETWCRSHQYRRVVVVADNDDVGRRGAFGLARRLEAEVVAPPLEFKDVRSWTRDRKLWEARLRF